LRPRSSRTASTKAIFNLLARPNIAPSEAEIYNGGQPVGDALESWIKSAPGFRPSQLTAPLRVQAMGRLSLLGEWEIYASLKIQSKPVDMV
jgi:hypothetical protein